MKASSDNKDCLPWSLVFYLVGFSLSKQCAGAEALPHEKCGGFWKGKPSAQPSTALATWPQLWSPVLLCLCQIKKGDYWEPI